MCGRFAVTTDPAKLAEKIKAIDEATGTAPNAAAPNYNVAPTATIATVVTRHAEPDDDPTRRVRLMRWGLIPPWVKAGPDGAPENKGPLLINARADKVTTSPAARGAARDLESPPMDAPGDHSDWRLRGVRVVRGDELDPNTPQTPGMSRKAAISAASAGAEKL